MHDSRVRMRKVDPLPSGLSMPRLSPVEKPRGVLLRFAYWASRKRFGTVPTNLKVIYPRVPAMMKFAMSLGKLEKGLRLDAELRHLVGTRVSAVNGCGWCVDFAQFVAMRKEMPLDKLHALPEYQTSPLFTARERAAIAYAEEVARTKGATDGTFDALREHFADWEIAELTVIIALQTMTNMMNIPLGIDSDGLCLVAQDAAGRHKPVAR